MPTKRVEREIELMNGNGNLEISDLLLQIKMAIHRGEYSRALNLMDDNRISTLEEIIRLRETVKRYLPKNKANDEKEIERNKSTGESGLEI